MAQSVPDQSDGRAHVSPEAVITLATKVAFLSRPGSYPGAPETVDAIETRLSWVFLTPDRAWKLKKPVRYDHLDLSALGARRADCEAEVRLNRPLAPDVYLGVEALVWTADGHLEIGGGGRPVDFLVCMRRLANERCLENRIRAGHVDPDGVERAAVRLARFYGDAPAAGCVDPDFILGEVDGEAVELARLPLGAEAGAERLHGALHEGAEILREQLGRRQRREVHGDLRPQHIYPGDPPVFLDRLTFRQQLRLMDPVEELAFLALDCDRLGAGWVGERFLATYARIAGDDVPPAVVAWYRARRAHLWALLSGRHLLRGAPEEPWRGIARRYLELGLASIADVRG